MLSYNVDILEKSNWYVSTPSEFSQKLPFFSYELGHFYCRDKYYTERSNQNNYFLMYTVSGSGKLIYENEEIYITPGNAVFVDCRKYHRYLTAGNEIWNYRWIHFDGKSVETYYNMINDNGIELVSINDNDAFENYFEHIGKNMISNDNVSNIRISAYISMMLTAMVNDRTYGNDDYIKKRSEIKKLVELINKNYKEKLTVDIMSQKLHLSKFYIIKLFKKYTGFTPYDYLINVRINNAKKLLKNSDLPIREVSEEVGFADESSFIRKFKCSTGYTPLGYRKNF